MNEGNAIEVHGVYKNFKVYGDKGKTLKDLLTTTGRKDYKMRKILDGIDFSVKKGEAVALIGKNGCGKSTTLKLLTRIIYPDQGKIEISGKVSSLLELGAGFHPDMSGRENIYLNASIFGLTRKEIDEKVDTIISFSELENYIENPVRTYSSGMYMRLAFSVAINVDADILLIDEILGVGDVSFQKKCFEKLKEIKNQGTTIVIVSHSMEQVQQICDRSIWIYDGKIKEDGNPYIVGQHYYALMEGNRLDRIEKEYFENKRKKEILQAEETENVSNKLPLFCEDNAVYSGTHQVTFSDITVTNQKGEEAIIFNDGDSLLLKCKITGLLPEQLFSFSISISNEEHVHCYGTNSFAEKNDFFSIRKNETLDMCFELKDIRLINGKYWVSVGLYTPQFEALEEIHFVKFFHIHSNSYQKETGIIQLEHAWDINSENIVHYPER